MKDMITTCKKVKMNKNKKFVTLPRIGKYLETREIPHTGQQHTQNIQEVFRMKTLERG
jgi:hypothetical protein